MLSADNGTDKFYQHDGFSTTINDSFSAPGGLCKDLAWDGTNLYSVDYGDDKIYKHPQGYYLNSYGEPKLIQFCEQNSFFVKSLYKDDTYGLLLLKRK